MRIRVVSMLLMFCIFLSVLMLSVELYAQVATPSFDPTETVVMPAAAGWRPSHVVGASYHESNGERVLDGKSIYQFDGKGGSGNMVLSFKSFTMEAYSEQNVTNVKLDKYYDGEINLAYVDTYLSFALLGSDSVSVGLGSHTMETKDYIDINRDNEITKQVSSTGGVSLKFGDSFFIGFGVKRTKETSTYKVENTWDNGIAGIAMRFGEPGSVQFRVEYSSILSNKKERAASSSLAVNTHPKTTTVIGSAELVFSGLLFALKNTVNVQNVTSTNGSNEETTLEVKSTKSQGGIIWAPKGGIALGFYFETDKIESTFEDDLSSFKVNLGYAF